MIPLFDRNPTRRFPYVTVGLILANLAVFVYMLTLGSSALDTFIYRFAAVPWEVIHGHQLPALDLAQLLPLAEPGMSKNVYLSLATCMFLHAGWLHILFNMLFLGVFGNNVEDAMGHLPFLFFYMLSGAAATMLHVAVFPDSIAPLVGASGAIAGVMGAYLVLFPRARIYALVFIIILPVPAWVFIGVWIGYQFIAGLASQSSVTENVAWFAHIGGVAFGVAVSLFFYPLLRRRRERDRQARRVEVE
jgi:membrane associated rhomboid family serine protease